jgi:hypothetical protein
MGIAGLIREKPVPVMETGFSRSVPKIKQREQKI